MSAEEKEMTVGKILLSQFNSSWKMLHQAIEKVPEDLWSKPGNNWTYSMNTYHIIETADFYSRPWEGLTAEGMEWGKRAGINWESESKTTIDERVSRITKEDLLVYLEEIIYRISELLESLAENELLERDSFHHHITVLEKLLYLLRHNMHHIGELNKTLRDSESERIKWC